MWQLQLLQSKLETITVKLEISERNQQQIKQQMVAKLSDVQDDIQALKMRQDLVFRKQDIMQSTLAGEIPTGFSANRSAFRSPSAGPSVVAWSQPFYGNLLQQPQISGGHPHETAMHEGCMQTLPKTQSSLELAHLEQTYTTQVDSID